MANADTVGRPRLTSSTTRQLSPGRSIGLVGAGQALESYDFLLFGLLSPFLGAQFFGSDPLSGTLNALAVYGVGFVARPFGALFFGWISDRVGRRPMMLLSVSIMALSSLLIGLMPTASVMGIWATVALVLLRIVQGLAFGIEAPLNGTYNVELGKRDRLGWYSGLIASWVQLGLLTASLVAFFTSLALGKETMGEWGWRIPFLVGGVLGLFVLVLRRGLPETLHEKDDEADDAPLRHARDAHETTITSSIEPEGAATEGGSRAMWRQIGRHWFSLLAAVFVVGGVQILNYALLTALPSYAQAVDSIDPTIAFGVTSGFGLIILILCPIAGRLADRWRFSRFYVVARWLLVPAIFLLLAYQGGNIGIYIAIVLVGAVVLSPNLAIFNPIGASLVPRQGRVTGSGIAYSVGVALFGGTASYLYVWLQSIGLVWVFCVYGATICLLSIFLYQAAVRRNGLYAGR